MCNHMIVFHKTCTRMSSGERLFFFDTETTGLPTSLSHPPHLLSQYDSSRVIELAYILVGGGRVVKRVSFLIRPTGFVIPQQATVVHGITDDFARENGFPWSVVFDALEQDLVGVTALVAHNIRFDVTVLLSECYRAGRSDIADRLLWTLPGPDGASRRMPRRCTMLLGTESGKLWPRLAVLYRTLCPALAETQRHRAVADTEMCLQCYSVLMQVPIDPGN